MPREERRQRFLQSLAIDVYLPQANAGGVVIWGTRRPATPSSAKHRVGERRRTVRPVEDVPPVYKQETRTDGDTNNDVVADDLGRRGAARERARGARADLHLNARRGSDKLAA